jgi:hypothetical protein
MMGCRQVVTAERHLYGDPRPCSRDIGVAELNRGPTVRIHLSPADSPLRTWKIRDPIDRFEGFWPD